MGIPDSGAMDIGMDVAWIVGDWNLRTDLFINVKGCQALIRKDFPDTPWYSPKLFMFYKHS